ncbi:Cyclin-like protein [Giardia duodenalis]|uniref:Cyclin-like protein n=2 Tax=Giardia intestinalis TaxID=5741 RepID=A8BR09_GIAIC|nr:Cyclin-like protein [Giardia intestinalis]KAE8304308.1 Cyclin-like protein [Giardia intestinalis]|eukprot:XP_001705398.1 Hypothetical protein GL50803_13874 [Giardia lamblia ATCC 50803]
MSEEVAPGRSPDAKGFVPLRAIARFIRKMCTRPTTRRATSEPDVDLESFLEHINDRADLPRPCFTYAVVLLKHLAERYAGKITPNNIIRVTFASIIVAAGMLQDITYNLDAWADIGNNYYSKTQLCTLQTQFLQSLGYEVHVMIDEYARMNNDILVYNDEIESVETN